MEYPLFSLFLHLQHKIEMYLLRRGGTLVNRNLAKTSHRRRYTISREEIQNIYTSGKKVEFKIRNMLGSLLQVCHLNFRRSYSNVA